MSLEDGVTLTIREGTTVNLANGVALTIAEGAGFDVEPGVTFKMGSGARIIVHPTATIAGTQAKPIRFERSGAGRWNSVNINGADSEVSWAVFDGGLYNLRLTGSGATVGNSTFRNGMYGGLWVEGADDATIQNNRIHSNSGDALLLMNTSGNVTIRDNSVVDNWRGIGLWGSQVQSFFGNVVENNSRAGVQVFLGSHLFMQLQAGGITYKGQNRIRNNGEHQIMVNFSSRVFLGHTAIGTPVGGYNTVYQDNKPFENKFIYSLALTGPGYDSAPFQILAHWTYWNGYPTSGRFHGSVDYYPNYLASDPTSGSGAGPGTTPMMVGGDELLALSTVMTARTAEVAAAGYETDDDALKALELKQRFLDARNALNRDLYDLHNARRLNELYTLYLLDPDDRVGEHAAVEALFSEWSARRDDLAASYRDHEQVRLAVETAMILQVSLAMRNQAHDAATEMIADYAPYVENLDHRTVLMEHSIVIMHTRGQYAGALEMLDDLEALEPEEAVRAWYHAPTYAALRLAATDGVETAGAVSGGMALQEAAPRERVEIPVAFSLDANYPNPFNPATRVPFSLPAESHVTIEVYDMTGRRVGSLTDRVYSSGSHQVAFEAQHLASGTYLLRAIMAEVDTGARHTFTRTATLVK